MWDFKYFKSSEFDSKDLPGSGERMNLVFVRLLDELRERVGRPLVITSGYRTPERNRIVGGVADSPHVGGWAADIRCLDSALRFAIISNWFEMRPQIVRIGIRKDIVHLDIDPSKPNGVIWLY